MGVDQSPAIEEAPVRYKLTVDDFLLLDRSGALDKLGRVELIEGELIVMSPLFSPHGRTYFLLTVAIGDAIDRSGLALVGVTKVSTLFDTHNLPQPDLAVLDADALGEEFLQPSAAKLFVEVASSSLAIDSGAKLRLYARGGVPEYWIADVKARQIIRHAEPVGEGYASRDVFAFGAQVPAATIAGFVVDTRRLAGA